MKHCKVLLGLVLAGAAFSGTAHAQTIAINLTTPPVRTGSQAYPLTLGQDFTVVNAISVIELGAFDSSQNGFAGTITTGIFSRSGNTGVLLASMTFTPGSPGTLSSPAADTSSAYRFKTIPLLILGPGTYTVGSWGYSPNDPNGNTAFGDPAPTFNGGGFITFQGARFQSSGAPGGFPDSPDTATYLAGTFTFTAAPTPEPGTVSLLAGILVSGTGFAVRRRLRRRK